MARTDTTTSLATFLDNVPNAIQEARSLGPNDLNLVHTQTLRNLACTVLGQGAAKIDSGLVVSDPTTSSTITIYRVNISAGIAKVAGLFGAFNAQANVILLGAGTWAKSYALDGSDAAVLSADGQTYMVALVAVRATSGIVLCAVFGDEDDDGDEEDVSSAQIRTALDAALVATPAGPLAGLDTSSFVVFGRMKIQRVAVDTITVTHTNTITDSGLLNERLGGTLGSLS